MKLSIIIPCFNEERTIKEIIEKITSLNDIEKEIIVIDDNSSDNSKSILQNDLKDKIDQLILNDQNYGKGYSIRQGINKALGDIILIQDADLEYDPIDYYKLLNPIKKDWLM